MALPKLSDQTRAKGAALAKKGKETIKAGGKKYGSAVKANWKNIAAELGGGMAGLIAYEKLTSPGEDGSEAKVSPIMAGVGGVVGYVMAAPMKGITGRAVRMAAFQVGLLGLREYAEDEGWLS